MSANLPPLAPINDEKIDHVASISFYLVHLIALVVVLTTGFSFSGIGWALGLYALRMFGLTAGYHRYFSHRTYKTSRVAQFLMALLGTLAVQKGVLWWAAHHRHHHRYSDQPEDVHSPRRGLWWSHAGWILCKRWERTRVELVPDLVQYPELRWLNSYYLIVDFLFGAALYFVFGATALLWGFFVGTVILWHGTFTINSLAHRFGRRRYETGDTSRNSMILALITLGEGWHNNHHHYPGSTSQGFFWWEIDISYMVLKVMSFFGLVWDLHLPPARALALAPATAPTWNPSLVEPTP